MGIRAKPDVNQVKKLITKIEPFDTLSVVKKLNVMFDGIITYEQGPTIATVAMSLRPNETEIIAEKDEDGLDVEVTYPTLNSVDKAGGDLRQFKRFQLDERKMVVYPNRGPNGTGEWRYFNMQRVDEWNLIDECDKAVIKALKRSIQIIKTILKENPDQRNRSNHTHIQQMRYDLKKREKLLQDQEKRKKDKKGSGDTEQHETDEK